MQNFNSFIFITMKYIKTCECCGNKIKAYTYNLNARNVEMLEKLYRFYLQKRRPANISELWLSPVEYSVFSKMKHFWIITNVIRNIKGKDIAWRIPTLKGIERLQGKRTIESRTASFWKQTLPLDHEARGTDKKGWKPARVREIKSNYKRKQPEEYKEEATETLFDY